jgi:hypothetical protein
MEAKLTTQNVLERRGEVFLPPIISLGDQAPSYGQLVLFSLVRYLNIFFTDYKTFRVIQLNKVLLSTEKYLELELRDLKPF